MALLEDRTAVFIVRVWCERGDIDTQANQPMPEWRGSVEHVQSGQRMFFRNLDAVCEFMKPHLESIGIDAQQRFWERISSVIDDVAPTPEEPALIPLLVPKKSAPSITARKRR
ncbi:MAG: hypothetical protein LC715_05530 [Gammaproteobacteria bacterium]|nr:hypothetical protein [Gammaproteobacteria bacterium]